MILEKTFLKSLYQPNSTFKGRKVGKQHLLLTKNANFRVPNQSFFRLPWDYLNVRNFEHFCLFLNSPS